VDPVSDRPDELARRARAFRRARVAIVALVLGYFFLPYGIRAWIPVWLPFAAALAVELQFFLGGYLAGRSGTAAAPSTPDRGPQPHDLDELGGERWQELYGVEDGDGLELVPAAALEAEDDEDAEEAAGEEAAGDEAEPYLPARRSFLRHLPEALAAVAVVAGILFYAARPHGWAAVSSAGQARAEAVFSREATLIAGHPARIVCDTSGRHVGVVQEADGVAAVGGEIAYIVPDLCDRLYQLRFKHRVQSFSRTARAIAVLAHESWHLHGLADEGITNCYAFQSGVAIGTRLGLSEKTARAMMREQLATNAADSAGDIRYLVPPGCRNGGPYDLNPSSSAFP
jgi:hypothetical protein